MVPFEATFGLEGSAKILHSFQCQALPIATSLPPLTHGGQTPNPARGELVSLASAREFGQLHPSAHRRHFKRAWRRGLGAGAGQGLHGQPSKDAGRRRRRPLGLWPSGETPVPRRDATSVARRRPLGGRRSPSHGLETRLGPRARRPPRRCGGRRLGPALGRAGRPHRTLDRLPRRQGHAMVASPRDQGCVERGRCGLSRDGRPRRVHRRVGHLRPHARCAQRGGHGPVPTRRSSNPRRRARRRRPPQAGRRPLEPHPACQFHARRPKEHLRPARGAGLHLRPGRVRARHPGGRRKGGLGHVPSLDRRPRPGRPHPTHRPLGRRRRGEGHAIARRACAQQPQRKFPVRDCRSLGVRHPGHEHRRRRHPRTPPPRPQRPRISACPRKRTSPRGPRPFTKSRTPPGTPTPSAPTPARISAWRPWPKPTTPSTASFCNHDLASHLPVVVPDRRLDGRRHALGPRLHRLQHRRLSRRDVRRPRRHLPDGRRI